MTKVEDLVCLYLTGKKESKETRVCKSVRKMFERQNNVILHNLDANEAL